MSYDVKPPKQRDEMTMAELWELAPTLPRAERRACRQQASALQRKWSPNPARVIPIRSRNLRNSFSEIAGV